MASPREQLESATLEELADNIGQYNIANAEVQRRLAVWQSETLDAQVTAADAQVKAAKAAEDTAKYTRSAARWMFWSVVAIAITSAIQALFAFLTWLK